LPFCVSLLINQSKSTASKITTSIIITTQYSFLFVFVAFCCNKKKIYTILQSQYSQTEIHKQTEILKWNCSLYEIYIYKTLFLFFLYFFCCLGNEWMNINDTTKIIIAKNHIKFCVRLINVYIFSISMKYISTGSFAAFWVHTVKYFIHHDYV